MTRAWLFVPVGSEESFHSDFAYILGESSHSEKYSFVYTELPSGSISEQILQVEKYTMLEGSFEDLQEMKLGT